MSKFTEYLENNSSIITEAKTSSTTNLTKALLWGSRNLIKITEAIETLIILAPKYELDITPKNIDLSFGKSGMPDEIKDKFQNGHILFDFQDNEKLKKLMNDPKLKKFKDLGILDLGMGVIKIQFSSKV